MQEGSVLHLCTKFEADRSSYSKVTRLPGSPTCVVTSNLKLWVAVSSHHLQESGAYCGGRTTGRTAGFVFVCFLLVDLVRLSIPVQVMAGKIGLRNDP